MICLLRDGVASRSAVLKHLSRKIGGPKGKGPFFSASPPPSPTGSLLALIFRFNRPHGSGWGGERQGGKNPAAFKPWEV